MNRVISFLALLSLAAATWHGPPSSPWHAFGGHIATANRAGGTISLVNPSTLAVLNYTLPENAEPMYFLSYFRPARGAPSELWVGDRGNSRLQILQLRRRKLVPDGSLPTPAGLFHSMTTQNLRSRRPLAITTCDVANVTVVHDLRARRQLCVMPRPPEVARFGGKPHDATTDEWFAYVTYLGASNGAGYVASYVASTCELLALIRTASDPHVAVRPGSRLWVAAQGGQVLSRTVPWLQPLTNDSSLVTPHGIFISFDSRFVYIVLIGTGGKDAVKVYDQHTGERIPCPTVNMSFTVPHNPTTSFDGKRLFVTHSIRGQAVNSAWDLNTETGCVAPESERIFRTGAVPFGITVIPPPRLYRWWWWWWW